MDDIDRNERSDILYNYTKQEFFLSMMLKAIEINNSLSWKGTVTKLLFVIFLMH